MWDTPPSNFQCFVYLQEEAALAAAEVAFILQSARGRAALQFAIAPDSPATPQQEQEPSLQQPQQQ